MILADEKAEPIYSIGKASRYVQTGEMITIPKDTPGPIYTPPDEAYYKFRYQPKWVIGNEKSPNLHNGEKFDYYNHLYSEEDDLGKLPKKWQRTIGGAMPLEPRVKYDYREGVPGPGRYNPNIKIIKPRDYTYFIGEKVECLSLKNLTGTNDTVGPGKYPVQNSKKTSVHTNFSTWTLGKSKRQGLYNKTWTKHETYEVYSSVGKQIRTKKRTESEIKIGKATRNGEKFRGMFPQMMDRQPQKVRIPMPKF